MSYRVLDLCGGIGGMALALQRAGFQVAAAVKQDRKTDKIYLKNVQTEKLPREQIQALELPDFDVLAGRFSPYLQGKGTNAEDENLKLFLRVLEARPGAFLAECPRNSRKGELKPDELLSCFPEEYAVYGQLLESGEVTGMPFTKKSLYLVGFRRDLFVPGFSFPGPAEHSIALKEILNEEMEGPLPPIDARWREFLPEYMEPGLLYFLRTGPDGKLRYEPRATCMSAYTYRSLPMIKEKGGVRPLTLQEYLRLKGFSEDFWLPEENVSLRTTATREPDLLVIQKIAEEIRSLLEEAGLPEEENGDSGMEETEILEESYTKEELLEEVFWSEEQVNDMLRLLQRHRNLLLKGAPGVGKTYLAKRLAMVLAGARNSKRIKMVQFHQNYTYEQFMMGYRPWENGFRLENGSFYTFCREAEKDPSHNYCFLIDELNRGNISKIFGEVLTLMEGERRGEEMILLYGREPFSIPRNVYILAMMNTADKSLTFFDYALFRRFAHYTLEPAFETEKFRERAQGVENERYQRLLECVRELNEEIAEDFLGEKYQIGHSYLCPEDWNQIDDQWVKDTVEFALLPLIDEYSYSSRDSAQAWKRKLESILL